METKPLTEKEIRKIAREESFKIVSKELSSIKEELKKQGEILNRLDRLLLGEFGTEQEDTLKARANFAYQYTKKNSDLRIVERTMPALTWFEDWNALDAGCKETKLELLGKLVTSYSHVRWLLTLIGITTVVNAMPIIETVLKWIMQLGE